MGACNLYPTPHVYRTCVRCLVSQYFWVYRFNGTGIAEVFFKSFGLWWTDYRLLLTNFFVMQISSLYLLLCPRGLGDGNLGRRGTASRVSPLMLGRA